jgi:hypothetical protein
MVSGPLTIFTAPEGTTFPEISATPGSPWALMGANGDKSISDDGLTVNVEEETNDQMVLGSTLPQKVFRVSEAMMFDFMLFDLTAEMFAVAMSGLAVSDVPAAVGTGGYRSVPLVRGFNINYQSFLFRGFSPYLDNAFAQYWIPKGYAQFSGEVQYQKGEAAALGISVKAYESGANGLGLYLTQDALPL